MVGTQSIKNFSFLIDRLPTMYLNVKLNYHYSFVNKKRCTRRGTQFVIIGMSTVLPLISSKRNSSSEGCQ